MYINIITYIIYIYYIYIYILCIHVMCVIPIIWMTTFITQMIHDTDQNDNIVFVTDHMNIQHRREAVCFGKMQVLLRQSWTLHRASPRWTGATGPAMVQNVRRINERWSCIENCATRGSLKVHCSSARWWVFFGGVRFMTWAGGCVTFNMSHLTNTYKKVNQATQVNI